MFNLWVLLLMALFTHSYEWFNTRISNIPCPPLIRVAKKFSYSYTCHKILTLVNGRGLMLLLLLDRDVSLNPGPLTLNVLNARAIRNKGPLLADIVASNDLDFLCLTETHIRPFDSDNFLRSITPPDFIFHHRPRLSGTGGGVGFFIRSSDRPYKIESLFCQSFENMVGSIRLHGHSLLLTCIYRPPGSCTCNFQEEFMPFFLFNVIY